MESYYGFIIIYDEFLPELSRWNLLANRWFDEEKDKDIDLDKHTEMREFVIVDTNTRTISANPLVIDKLSKFLKR